MAQADRGQQWREPNLGLRDADGCRSSGRQTRSQHCYCELSRSSPRSCCCTLDTATAGSPGGIYMTTVVLNRRHLLTAGASVLATGVSGLLLPARGEGLAATPSMPGGSNNYRE